MSVTLIGIFHLHYYVEKMTEVKSIKISKETYLKLSEVAGELQMKLKRPVSLDEAMRHLLRLREKRRGAKITDMAGSWSMSDEEWNEINSSLQEKWKKWRLPKTDS